MLYCEMKLPKLPKFCYCYMIQVPYSDYGNIQSLGMSDNGLSLLELSLETFKLRSKVEIECFRSHGE